MAEKIIRALLADGFLLRKSRGGSYRRYQHPRLAVALAPSL
jgi:predicted RNA binding protein YcfA (HicA-like mRNA interferase family)